MLTLAIIKPDAVASGQAGKVLSHLEGAGFAVRGTRMVRRGSQMITGENR